MNFTVDQIEKLIKAKAGVVMMMAPPGAGKSAIADFIAKKNDWQFIDLRLAQMDQSEITGLYDRDGEKVILRPQEWAFRANTKPTLVFFDELNRATREVRNAALQIFNERRCGWNFQFNENVFFFAAGNLGEEDNTDVEEFDDALLNRLIPIKINVQDASWREQWMAWATKEGKVHKSVTTFINKHPECFYKKGNEDDKSFATPRSWTYFSILLNSNNIINHDDILSYARDYLNLYVGASAARTFIKFMEDTRMVKAADILNNWEVVKNVIKDLDRDKISEIVNELKDMNINKFGKKQFGNVIEFCKMIDPDEVAGYIIGLASSSYTIEEDEETIDNSSSKKKKKVEQENLKIFLKEFESIGRKLYEKQKEAFNENT